MQDSLTDESMLHIHLHQSSNSQVTDKESERQMIRKIAALPNRNHSSPFMYDWKKNANQITAGERLHQLEADEDQFNKTFRWSVAHQPTNGGIAFKCLLF